jgi:hypothetical protein
MRIYIAFALLLASAGANAQVTSSSQTQVQSGSVAGASNSGVSLQNNFEAGDRMHYDYGTQRVEQVAPLSLGGAAAGFSNENCANTTQGGIATMWFSAAKGNATESIRCNARRDAGVYIALADDAKANGLPQADRLRSMAWYQKCSATPDELARCKYLGLVDPDGNPVVIAPRLQAIPSREAGTYWRDGQQVDPRKVPIDHSNDVRRNP